MTAAGATDYNKLTKAQKEQLKTIANEAASEVGISLVFRSKAVDIYKDGKKVLVITNNNGKLSYTGNKSNIAVIAVSSVAVIALAAVVIKKDQLLLDNKEHYLKHAIKATIRNIIVAFLVVIAFFGLIRIFLGRQIDLNVSLVNKIAVQKINLNQK